MKKHYKKILFNFVLTLLLCTCKDPVFWAISQEVKPVDPMISGVPTNFAVFNNLMYVAAGRLLYMYNGVWCGIAVPGGNILQIASTSTESSDGYLYVLCTTDQNNDGLTIIKRLDKNNSWSLLGGIPNSFAKIHNIYAAGGVLFILATSWTTENYIYYSIYYIDNDDPNIIKKLQTGNPADTGRLTGAAYNGTSYFLSTNDRGVYKIDNIDNGATLIPIYYTNFTGIINLEDTDNTIVLITRYGLLYTVNDTLSQVGNISIISNGALAIWRENDQPDSGKLLLIGRQGSVSNSSSSYSYGYVEVILDSDGKIGGNLFPWEPGLFSPSTVVQGDNERYQSTIGKYPVNYLFQVPAKIDSKMILFASTQKNGVWSYRVRGGLPQWNAE